MIYKENLTISQAFDRNFTCPECKEDINVYHAVNWEAMYTKLTEGIALYMNSVQDLLDTISDEVPEVAITLHNKQSENLQKLNDFLNDNFGEL